MDTYFRIYGEMYTSRVASRRAGVRRSVCFSFYQYLRYLLDHIYQAEMSNRQAEGRGRVTCVGSKCVQNDFGNGQILTLMR